MTALPRPVDPARHALARSLSLLCLTLSFLVLSTVPGVALADASHDAWPYGWRPNWIPGDPLSPGIGYAPAPWIVGSSAAPGMIVALDPVTRLPVRPTPAQRAAAAAAFDAGALLGPPDGFLPAVRIPGGGEFVHLQGRFQIFSVARRNADGTFTTECVTDPSRVRQTGVQPPPAERRREER